MPRETTTIEVTTDAWSGLNQLKGPGDSFDNVIRRLLGLAGVNIEPPEDDEGYVAGDVVLAEKNQNGESIQIPSMKIRDKRADETGDYEVVYLSKLKWGADSTKPRARGYLRDGVSTLNYNDDKIVELNTTSGLVDS